MLPEERTKTTPYVEDSTQLNMHVITPSSEAMFGSINRDIVLANLKETDLKFFRATQNIIESIKNLELTPSIRKEIQQKYTFQDEKTKLMYKEQTPLDRVAEAFISEMAILANASRGLDMAQAKLLQTSITKSTNVYKNRQEQRGLKGVFTKQNEDEENYG